MEFGILGPLEVWLGGEPIRVGGPKERSLLAMLLLHPNEVVSTDRLIDDLWRGAPPATARGTLQTYVSHLRRALDRDDGPRVAARGSGYALRVDPGESDAVRFEQLTRDGSEARAEGNHRRATEVLSEALSLWRGPALADFEYEDFARPTIARLEELRLCAHEERLEAELDLGRHSEVLGELEALVATNPLRERLRGALILARYRCGQQADALRAYDDLRVALADELGIDPSPPLQRLHLAVLRQDSALDAPARGVRATAADLPSGEVTFLLTDVVGSTGLWESEPTAAAKAVARHDEIVGEIVSGFGGVVLKARGEGDSTFSVFREPASAVRAALALQRALLGESWPPEASLRVRVAVHTGPAEPRDNDYVGPTANRAARLRACGHGGQVLVSATTAELVQSDLPDGATLRDLGERRLRDIRAPQHVFQLEHPDLPAQFPPLTALDARPSNLPLQPTSFVGRDDVLDRVARMLRRESSRLVTLVGPGGIGKTRLALQVAGALVDDFAHGVCFVPLAPVESADQVPGTVLATLGSQAEPGATATASIVEHLGDRRLLLVLDNYEHVMDAATLVADVHANCPRVAILTTSREWLHVTGEHVVRVEPLADAAAAALFVDRARAVRPDVDEVAHNDVVEQVCRRLDGLPLAIELVAARTRHLDPETVLGQLDSPLNVAVGGPRDHPSRQRTLRDALAWSVGLLEPPEARAFARLSVFRGPFASEAAAAVLGTSTGDAVGMLFALADKSLLTTIDGGQFSMLATIEAYAAELLDASPAERHAAREGHFCHMASSVKDGLERCGGFDEELFEAEAGAGVAFDRRHLDDLRSAVGFGTETGAADVALLVCELALASQCADIDDLLDRLEAVLALPALDDQHRYWVLVARAGALWDAGRHEDGIVAARQLIDRTTADRPAGKAIAYNLIGINCWRLGRWADAEAALRKAFEVTDGREGQSLVANNLGLVAARRGDLATAADWFEQALQLAEGPHLRRVQQTRLAEMALGQGRWEDAERNLEQLAAEGSFEDTFLAATDLVEVKLARGDHQAAVTAARRLLATMSAADEAGRPVLASGRTLAHDALGEALLGADEAATARAAFEAALRTAGRHPEFRARALHGLGLVELLEGDTSAACRRLEAAVELLPTGLVTGWAARLVADLASAERAAGRPDAGRERLTRALEAAVTAGHRPATSHLLCRLADAAAADEAPELASTLLGAAEGCREAVGIVAGPHWARGEDAAAAVARFPVPERERLRAAGRSMPLPAVVALVRKHARRGAPA